MYVTALHDTRDTTAKKTQLDFKRS